MKLTKPIMKKILYLSVCFLILSCSSSDSNSSSSSNPTLVLPSKTVETPEFLLLLMVLTPSQEKEGIPILEI